jgi:hypothetical protein
MEHLNIRICQWDLHSMKITVPRFVTNKVALGQVGLLRIPPPLPHPHRQLSNHQRAHVHSRIILDCYNRTISGRSTKTVILLRKRGQEISAQRMTGSLLYRSEFAAQQPVCQKIEPGAPDSCAFPKPNNGDTVRLVKNWLHGVFISETGMGYEGFPRSLG